MTEGNVYRVTFRTDGRRRRQMVALYLGYSSRFKSHAFSLRPEAGTVTLLPEDIIDRPVKMPDGTKVSLPKTV